MVSSRRYTVRNQLSVEVLDSAGVMVGRFAVDASMAVDSSSRELDDMIEDRVVELAEDVVDHTKTIFGVEKNKHL